MPPRKAVPKTRGVTTRHNKATADSLKAGEENASKRLRQEQTSSDDSDIEITVGDSVSQAEQEDCAAVQQGDSVNMQQHESAAAEPEVSSSLPGNTAGPPESSGRLSSFDSIIEFLRCRLLNLHSTAASSMPLRPKLQEVHDKLIGMLSNTAETPGANHSFLLIGSRGTGKSLVIQRVLAGLKGRYNTQEGKPVLGVVQLTGLAHTEDVVAFKEIARQLCKAFSLKYSKAASFSENLDFLREILQKLGRGHHVVIFVLDEFDLFARKAKQTTLYNLLDAVQTAGVQAAVIGLSCRHDVMELLEKRVRSRFSHRKHLIADLQEQDFAVPGDSPANVLSNMLTVHEQQPNEATCVGTSPADQAVQQWNSAVDDIMKAEAVLGQLKLMVNQGYGKPRDLADAATDALLTMTSQIGVLRQKAILAGIAAVRQVHSKQAWSLQAEVVGACSILELYILVAMYRLKRNGHDSANFEMVFEEYSKLMEQGNSVDRRNKAAALRAFERLIGSFLISYVDPRAEEKGGLREFHSARVNVIMKEIDEGLKMHKSCPSLIKTALTHEAVRSAYAIC